MEDGRANDNARGEVLVQRVVRQRMDGLDDETSWAAMCRRAARAEKDVPMQGLGDFNAANGTEHFIVVLCRSFASLPFHSV